MSIFALYNVNNHSMLRQKREESGTGICHVMQGKESKTCPYDSQAEMNDMLADQNDINELTRAQLDAISEAMAELQASQTTQKHHRRIGFIQDEE